MEDTYGIVVDWRVRKLASSSLEVREVVLILCEKNMSSIPSHGLMTLSFSSLFREMAVITLIQTQFFVIQIP